MLLQVKTTHWGQLPWRLCISGHHDSDIARAGLRKCRAQCRKASVSWFCTGQHVGAGCVGECRYISVLFIVTALPELPMPKDLTQHHIMTKRFFDPAYSGHHRGLDFFKGRFPIQSEKSKSQSSQAGHQDDPHDVALHEEASRFV